MPSFSATDCAPAPAGIKPVATTASHPSAAAATASYVAATKAAARWDRPAAGSGTVPVTAPFTVGRTGRPIGTSGTPTPSSSSAKSGGAHTCTSAPSARNCTASPTIGSTSPRDPYVINNTRISRLAFPSSGFGRRFFGTTRVLPQAPRCAIS